MNVLGIDIGGTGVKGALVDMATGQLVSERERIETPKPATPEAVIGVIQQLIERFNYEGPLGVGYPGVILEGKTMTAANLDKGWVAFAAAAAIQHTTGFPTTLVNDADAAGLAEMRFGAGRDVRGVVMVFTLGTGIGSAMFVDGKLIPNTELGHVFLQNHTVDAERYTSERARIEESLKWKDWSVRLDEYLHHMENLFWPSLIILGGGASKDHHKFIPNLTLRTPVVPAELRNEAGIIGAAMAVT